MAIKFVGNNQLVPSTFEIASPEEVINWCKVNKIRGIDTETIGDCWDGYIYTLQVGNELDQYVIDCTSYNPLLFKDILEDKESTSILQNSKYDLKFFLHLGIKPNKIYDTFIAECILTTGKKDRKLGLDALAEKYTKYRLDKSIRGTINYLGLTDSVIKYAAEDVIALELIMNKQLLLLTELDLINLLDLETDVVKVFAEMEYNGMYLNQEKWLAQAKERELQAHKFEEALNQYILANPDKYSKFIDKQLDLFSDERKTNINWSSPKQVLDILSISGLSVDSVNEKVIEKYKNSNELVSLYLDYKENSTAISKFGKDYIKWVNKSTGRVNTSYFQILDTGRVSSGKKDEFPNVQQLPALNEVRNCFEAEKGWKIVDCDYSAMELVIAGCVSNEDSWVEAFKNGYDLHSVVAETVYKTKWTTAAEEDCQYAINKQKCSCKEHKKMRDKIKTLNYLSLYGGGPNKLSAAINIPLEEAKQIISSYFNNLPKLSKFLDTLKHYGKTNLHIRTKKPYRRIRWFEPHNNDNNLISTIERQSGNTFIQGTGADIVKLAMNKMYSYREKNNVPVKFIMQLHDAIVCEVKEEYAEEWKSLQIGFMKEAFEDVIGHTIDVDGYVEDFWKK